MSLMAAAHSGDFRLSSRLSIMAFTAAANGVSNDASSFSMSLFLSCNEPRKLRIL